MQKIIEIQPKYKSIIKVLFQDGYSVEIDFAPFIDHGLSEPLSDFEYFKSAFIDDNGGISWPNGYDFCPNFLREVAKNNKIVTH